MKVIILGGSGTYGQIVSRLLVQSELVSVLVIAGRTPETTNSCASTLGPKALGVQIDILDETSLSELMIGADLVINLTGPEFRTILPALRASINAGVNYCDVGVDGGAAEAAFEALAGSEPASDSSGASTTQR